MEKLITVGVAVYNTEKYIKYALDSILNQSYKNIEIICVDDGSTDKSGEICDEYAQKYDNIKVYHRENSGNSAVKNFIISKAQGDYIGFVDSDDYVHRDFYKVLAREMENYNCDIAQMDAKAVHNFDNYEEINSPLSPYRTWVCDSKEALVSDYSHFGSLYDTYTTTNLYKKEVLKSFKFNENIRFRLDVSSKADILLNSQKFVRLNTRLYYYFQDNESSISHNRKKKKHINIDVNLYLNKVLFDADTENISKITQNFMISSLSTFGKISKHYEADLRENYRNKIVDFYESNKDKYKISNPIVDLLYKNLKNGGFCSFAPLYFELYRNLVKKK